VIAEARKVHDFLTVGAAAPLQEAAVAGLELPDSYYVGLRALYAQKRDVFLGSLRESGLPFSEPQGAYYVMVDISSLGFADDRTAAEAFVREAGVAGVPGSSFFREPEHRYLRFHFARGEDVLREAGARIAKFATQRACGPLAFSERTAWLR
jgi:aspartate/methionine/tyrosine aminotransferase